MSYIRPTQGKKYSKSDESLYAFLSGPHDFEREGFPEYFIESYGDIKEPEHFVEIACRIMEAAGVPLTCEEVNKLRKELELEPIDKIEKFPDRENDKE